VGIALKANIRLITRCRSFTLTVVGYWPIVSSEASSTDIPSDPSSVVRTGSDWLLARACARYSTLRNAASLEWWALAKARVLK